MSLTLYNNSLGIRTVRFSYFRKSNSGSYTT